MAKKNNKRTKDRVTRTPLKTRGELRCSGRVSSSCSTIKEEKLALGLELWVFNTTFNTISVIIAAVRYIGGGNQSTQRNPSMCCKSQTNSII
jgi:hypothetical protein